MSNITSTEYHNEIQSIANSIAEELLAEHDGDLESAQEEQYDRLHETIDGHQWIIYNYAHKDVIEHTDNDGAYLDVYGPEDLGQMIIEHGLDHVLMVQAFWAMMQDVSEQLEDAFENANEAYQAIQQRLQDTGEVV